MTVERRKELRTFAAMALQGVLSNSGETKKITDQCRKDFDALRCGGVIKDWDVDEFRGWLETSQFNKDGKLLK